MHERFGRAAFHQFMVEKIRMPKPAPTSTHRLLPEIPFSAVLTTNYDKLIETVYEKTDEYASPHYFTHQEYPELSMAVRSGEFYILKVHGTIDRIETVILGKSDYRDIIYNNRPLHQYLLSLFSSKTLLFLGYSLNDPDLMLVLDELRATFKDYTVTHYALMNADEVSKLRQKRFRQDYGIQILPYSPSSPDHPEVGQFLEEMAKAVKEVEKSLKPQVEKVHSPIQKLAEEIRICLQALRYDVSEIISPDDRVLEMKASLDQGTIKQTVLVRCIGGEIRDSDVDAMDEVLTRKVPQGWLISDKRISKLARDRAAGDDAYQLFTLSEFLGKRVWKNYFEMLTTLVEDSRIHEKYVDLACYRQDVDKDGTEIARENYESLDKYIDSWLKELGKMHISLLGEFGTGKTWFCRHYAYRQLERYLQDPVNERLPLLITLRDFTKALTAQQLINDALLLQYKLPLIGNAFDVFMEMNRRGKVLLILDGFDEMARKADYQTVVDNFWELAKLADDSSKVLLTSRTEYFRWAKETEKVLGGEAKGRQTIELFPPKFDVFYLEPFNDDQIRQVIINYLETEKGEAATECILKNENLSEMARKPLLIELLLAAVEEVDLNVLGNQAQVYLYATNRLLLRNIDTQRTFTSTADKLYFLCELAWEMISSNELKIHYKEIPQRVQSYFGEKIKDAHELDHWDFDLRNQTLLHRNAAGYYEFAHKSLAEYFVAFKFVAELGFLAPEFLELAQNQFKIYKDAAPLSPDNVPRNTYAFAADMVSNDPLTLDKLCKMTWEGMTWEVTGKISWSVLSILPFLKYQHSETIAKMLVQKSEGQPLKSGVTWVLGELGVADEVVLNALKRTIECFATDNDASPFAWWESAFALEKLGYFGLRKGRQGDEPINFLIKYLPPNCSLTDSINNIKCAVLAPAHEEAKINQRDVVVIVKHETEINHSEFFDEVLSCLDFSEDNLRKRCYYVVWLCGHLGIKDSVEYIIKACEQPSNAVRNCASEALGKIGIISDVVVECLEKRLTEMYYRVRFHAAWSLGELGATQSIPKLSAAIEVEEVLDVRKEMLRVRNQLKERLEQSQG